MTIGTKYALTTSASRAIGAREPCACSTASTMRASAVSPPVRVTSNVSAPLWFSVPPKTSAPARLVDGQALAGEHRLVDGGRAAHDLAVGRDPLAGPHEHAVADGERRDRRRPPRSHRRAIRRAVFGDERDEPAHGVGEPLARARLEQLAEQHERDDRGGRLEVEVRHRAVRRRAGRGPATTARPSSSPTPRSTPIATSVFMSAVRCRSAAHARRRNRLPGPNTIGVASANCVQRPNGPAVPGIAPWLMPMTRRGTVRIAAIAKSRRIERCSRASAAASTSARDSRADAPVRGALVGRASTTP